MSGKNMNKYLKYKYKYLKLKEMVGGLDKPNDTTDNVHNNNVVFDNNNVLEQYNKSYDDFSNNYTFKNGNWCWNMEDLANFNLKELKNRNNTTKIDATHEIDTTREIDTTHKIDPPRDKSIQKLTNYLVEIKTSLTNLNTNIQNLSIPELMILFIKLSVLNDEAGIIMVDNSV